jgi:hypothetical protein
MGVSIRALCQCFGRKWGSRGPLVRPAGQLDLPGGQVFWLHRPWALDTPCTDFVDTLAGQGGGADRPHFGSVWPEICTTSSPHVILSVTMPYFGHIEDMHGCRYVGGKYVHFMTGNTRRQIRGPRGHRSPLPCPSPPWGRQCRGGL